MRYSVFRQVPTYGTLRRTLKQALFGQRVRCPRCEYTMVKKIKREERWRCKRCHHTFSLKSVSWLKGSKLPLETIWLLLWCWQQEVPLKQTVKIVGVSYPTVSTWFQTFRRHIPPERLHHTLGGTVVADEMFTSSRAVMGAKSVDTKKVVVWVLGTPDPQKHHAVQFLTACVEGGSHLRTDKAGIYSGIENWHRVTHESEVHSKGQFELTAEIEGVWANFRTFIRRMYHHVTRDFLPELAAEFTLRFNRDEIFESPEQYWRICLSSCPLAL